MRKVFAIIFLSLVISISMSSCSGPDTKYRILVTIIDGSKNISEAEKVQNKDTTDFNLLLLSRGANMIEIIDNQYLIITSRKHINKVKENIDDILSNPDKYSSYVEVITLK